ncbi:MAG: hypothetical protein ACKO5Q_26560 [Microcystaceae cyanobacterium]
MAIAIPGSRDSQAIAFGEVKGKAAIAFKYLDVNLDVQIEFNNDVVQYSDYRSKTRVNLVA